jgi:ribosomal protein S27AE
MSATQKPYHDGSQITAHTTGRSCPHCGNRTVIGHKQDGRWIGYHCELISCAQIDQKTQDRWMIESNSPQK